MNPSHDERLKQAILKSMHDEKKPAHQVWGLAIGLSLLVALITFIIIGGMQSLLHQPAWFATCSLWGLMVLLGLRVYLRPEPRIQVRSFFQPSTYALAFLISIGTAVIELVLCPHFAFLGSTKSGWNFFERITDFYMSLGGHHICMFLCGLTFSLISSVITALIVARSLACSRFHSVLSVIALTTFAHAPLFVYQFMTDGLNANLIHWSLGVGSGILSGVLMIYAVTSLKLK